MEVRKRSSKEPFRRMHYQVRHRTQRMSSYGAGLSDPSSPGEDMNSYYDEARYLSKEQMKAYIYKMKKEIEDYKVREMNYKIEIKYLRRKIERLKGIIQNDTFFFNDQRGISVRSKNSGFSFQSGMNKVNSEENCKSGRYRSGNVSEGNNYHHRGFTKRYDSHYGLHDHHHRNSSYRHRHFYEDNISEDKISNVSMRSINASIQNNKRMNVRNLTGRYSDTCRRSEQSRMVHAGKVHGTNNTSGCVDRSNKLKKYSRENIVHAVPIPRNVINDKPSENGLVMPMRGGSDSFRSNRSYTSCTSKFKIKGHLISNRRNMRNMSTDINTSIANDIKSYHTSKQSILSGTNQQLFDRNSSSLQKRSGAGNVMEARTISGAKQLSIEKLSKLTPREVRKKINCDLFDYFHHQRILSKKYTSPYAFKREISVSRMASCDKASEGKGSPVHATEGENGDDKNEGDDELSDTGDSIKRAKLYLDKQREMRKPQVTSAMPPSSMPADPTTVPTVVATSGKKNDRVSARGRAKEVTTGTVLINKEEKKNETNSKAKGSHTKLRVKTHLKTKEAKQRQDVLESTKKKIDADIKENFKKELEELKRRKDILVSKRSDYCDLSFGSTSSSGSGLSDNRRGGREGAERMGNTGKGGAQFKAVNNPLKESNILNISFNDLDKRINNLKNYLKNTNG
ncbi:conserved Plasmodium protein, unknown function [Plasmodium knowlesi strain H]|uniref:Uncharacterized protein n=3 Tax=Plasmodium knowlesi TaxID=5850 RepID=A0A5E7X4S6_PLAKH|nr:conserved Plasmodium protein, unknown function [Plasmodium knowlesi strain H]OTN68085.1 Uncharacterized protein PKNOH_S04343900 [Plasmodium knowlesi]CAA9990248.1 conserved Plasmodium protein, unknown function [Plasmodium knowlesi strain H]SBO26803.1 conserved Plasmodium protein, unknown function [Plasmodium knowlesi strain H]SBO28430.1 conserved Plasmodium protein, unknown function [Plasmodium knowlesi strain H]VVS79722.1 conserved Plasmodium protein, unknown function [Plasmodium knowlesi s